MRWRSLWLFRLRWPRQWMRNHRDRIKEQARAHEGRTNLTVWVRGDEERLEPTRKVRITAHDISPDGFRFRHGAFLKPGTTVLAYLPSTPHAHLVETEVCDCTEDPADGAYCIAVAVKGRSNRLPTTMRFTDRDTPMV